MNGHPQHPVHLVGVDHGHRRLLAPPPEHGVTAKLLGGSHSSGAPEHIDTGRVEPGLLLGLAQRGRGGVVAGVDRPAREDTWPGCERMWWARSVSSRSGPSGPSPKSISTAPSPGVGVLGRHVRE